MTARQQDVRVLACYARCDRPAIVYAILATLFWFAMAGSSATRVDLADKHR